MKSEHRHQLKTNELAEWIMNFPQWAKENATMIIYVSVFVVLIAAAYFWKIYEKDIVAVQKELAFTGSTYQLLQSKTQILRAQTRGLDMGYTLIQTADRLQDIAKNTKDDEMAAMALIKEAEALRTELHYRFGRVSRQNLTDQINRAKQAYVEAVEKSSSAPLLKAMAKFGLGLCEEELGNFDHAREIYNGIVTNPDFKYAVVVPLAKQRLSTMSAYQQQVVFKAAPKREQPAPEFMQPELNLEAPENQLETTGPNGIFEVPDFNLSGP
jgi:hypothetical protein